MNESYITSTQDYFLAKPQALDFSQSKKASRTINKWIKVQTRNKIKDLVKPEMLDALTNLVLVNAIYFNGEWDQKFQIKNTKKVDFHVTQNRTVKVDMMFNIKDYQ